MNIKQISVHELRHTLAASVGLIHLDATPEQYGAAETFISITPAMGEAAVHVPGAPILAGKAAQLCAYGPLAGVDGAIALFRSGDTKAIAHAGNLSTKDLELATSWNGPVTVPLTVILAVKAMEERIGFGRSALLAKFLRDASRSNFSPIPLEDVVPYKVAKRGWADGKLAMDKLLDAGTRKATLVELAENVRALKM